MRLVIIVLVLLTMYLQYGLWYTRGGRHDVEKLKASVQEQKDEIARLKERNRSLAAEVMDLKQGLEAIEERARSEMGMIKNGEVFFRITDPNHEHDQPQSVNALAKGNEAPLEPPLDPLAPGDAASGDSPEAPPVAREQAASVKPMVKAIVGAAAARSVVSAKASSEKPVTKSTATGATKATTAKPNGVTTSKPAVAGASKATVGATASKPPTPSAAKPSAKAVSPTPAKSTPKAAPTATVKAKPVAPTASTTGSRGIAPSSAPRPMPKPAPSAAPPRSATAFE